MKEKEVKRIAMWIHCFFLGGGGVKTGGPIWTYIDEPGSSGGWGELKDSTRVIVLHDDDLPACEAGL